MKRLNDIYYFIECWFVSKAIRLNRCIQKYTRIRHPLFLILSFIIAIFIWWWVEKNVSKP